MKDPYQSGMFKESPYYAKRDVQSSLVVVLQGQFEDRGLQLIQPVSRGVRQHEIHELIATDEGDAGPGSTVNRIGYLGFVEIARGGVIISGDEVLWDGQVIGTLAGFDETHMPNHLNIVIRCDQRLSGAQRGLRLEGAITFRHAKNK